MSDNNLKIRKVFINSFIEVLMDLYNKGVDYVDLIATINDDRDILGISFCKEYMSDEYKENFDNIPEEEFDEININLSDDDLNQLL